MSRGTKAGTGVVRSRNRKTLRMAAAGLEKGSVKRADGRKAESRSWRGISKSFRYVRIKPRSRALLKGLQSCDFSSQKLFFQIYQNSSSTYFYHVRRVKERNYANCLALRQSLINVSSHPLCFSSFNSKKEANVDCAG